jgi:16S rRNA (adenine1518-N6/adenine1519-N6)-dimethyltransferase
MENPYIYPARVRAALRSLELRPTRGMGQNFLIDSHALHQIVEAGQLTSTDTVLEIGPGLGVLTWELLQRAGNVIAVELDRRLVDRLLEEFHSYPQLQVVQGDILRFAPADLVHNPTQISATKASNELPPQIERGNYKVIANLPYAITSAALRHLLETRLQPALIVVLVQWEVATRICATPGDLSVLAHSVQIYAEPKIVARVPASSFIPAPAVDSAILALRVRPTPAVALSTVTPLLRLIKAGFLQARKQLANALPNGLAAMGQRVEKPTVLAALHKAQIDSNRRAETLSLTEWHAVLVALQQHNDPTSS